MDANTKVVKTNTVDGAAAVIMISAEKAKEPGIKPLAR